jgi:hypothetical protein
MQLTALHAAADTESSAVARMKGVFIEFRSIARPMRFTAGRNLLGLTERQIAYCVEVWAVLCADRPIAFETSEAVQYASRTRFDEAQNTVFLGADALPGDGVDANARLSTLACLAHELAHADGLVVQASGRPGRPLRVQHRAMSAGKA